MVKATYYLQQGGTTDKHNMNIQAAKNLVKIIATFTFIACGSVSVNTAAAVIGLATGDAGFEGGLIETSGNVAVPDTNIGVLTVAGTSTTDADTIVSDQLGKVLNADIVNTSIVPLPAAAWMLGSALLGLVSIARRRQKNES